MIARDLIFATSRRSAYGSQGTRGHAGSTGSSQARRHHTRGVSWPAPWGDSRALTRVRTVRPTWWRRRTMVRPAGRGGGARTTVHGGRSAEFCAGPLNVPRRVRRGDDPRLAKLPGANAPGPRGLLGPLGRHDLAAPGRCLRGRSVRPARLVLKSGPTIRRRLNFLPDVHVVVLERRGCSRAIATGR